MIDKSFLEIKRVVELYEELESVRREKILLEAREYRLADELRKLQRHEEILSLGAKDDLNQILAKPKPPEVL